MLKLVLAFYFSTHYFSAVSKKTGSPPTLVKNEQTHTHLRIIGGRDINSSEYSFAAVLFVFSEDYKYGIIRVCTASMITAHWVITAAHCVEALQAKQLYVWYGDFTTPPSKSKMFSAVLDIVKHPGYRSLHFDNWDAFVEDNDICLLRVSGIHVPQYGRLSSVDHSTLVGLPVSYVGGGRTNKSGDEDVLPLQLGEGAIVACNDEFRDLTRYLICISPKCTQKLHRPDEGDSGGPLLYDGKIIGVLSYGQNTDVFANDGYTPVSPYLDWIYEMIKSN